MGDGNNFVIMNIKIHHYFDDFVPFMTNNISLLLQNSKSTFKDSDIDALLRDNKENVRIARPVHSGSHFPSKDEL